jgi:hypothetical protein
MNQETIERYRQYAFDQDIKYQRQKMEADIRSAQISNAGFLAGLVFGYVTRCMWYSSLNPNLGKTNNQRSDRGMG